MTPITPTKSGSSSNSKDDFLQYYKNSGLDSMAKDVSSSDLFDLSIDSLASGSIQNILREGGWLLWLSHVILEWLNCTSGKWNLFKVGGASSLYNVLVHTFFKIAIRVSTSHC